MTLINKILGTSFAIGCGILSLSPLRAAEYTPTYVWAGYVFDTDLDGNGNSIDLDGQTIIAGELDQASVNRLERALLRFSMPAIPEGETIVSATLRLYVTGVPTSVSPAQLYWSNDSKTLANNYSSSYYQNTTFVNTGLQVASTSTTANSWVELNVTSFVLSDYANSGSTTYSWFRIQVDGLGFVEDNISHRYGFASENHADTTLRPQLIVVTASNIPEPSTYGILFAGVAGFWAATRRRIVRHQTASKNGGA
jgi:PEP-CTERM putative exosortase interaction domain